MTEQSRLIKKANRTVWKNLFLTVLFILILPFLVWATLDKAHELLEPAIDNRRIHLGSTLVDFVGLCLVIYYLALRIRIGMGGVIRNIKDRPAIAIRKDLEVYGDPAALLSSIDTELSQFSSHELVSTVVTPHWLINFSRVGLFAHSIMPIGQIKELQIQNESSKRYHSYFLWAIDNCDNKMLVDDFFTKKSLKEEANERWSRMASLKDKLMTFNPNIEVTGRFDR